MINKFKIKNLKLKNNAGFTVLESIVAIFVLSLAISGAFSAVRQSLNQSILSKDEIRAFYIAQEAFEIIRNKRDTNQLAHLNGGTNTWLTGISEVGNGCYFGNVCMVSPTSYDFDGEAFVSCGMSWNSCPNLQQDGQYLYSYGFSFTPTNLKREIMIESISADEISVTVRVSWTKGLISKEFKVKTHLFNWI